MKDCKQLTKRADKSSNLDNRKNNGAHTIAVTVIRTKIIIRSSRRESLYIAIKEKYGATISKLEAKQMYTPPGIGLSFAVCYLPLSQQADCFQLLIDSGSSKYVIDPELICGVESRMFEYTKKNSHGDKSCRG